MRKMKKMTERNDIIYLDYCYSSTATIKMNPQALKINVRIKKIGMKKFCKAKKLFDI